MSSKTFQPLETLRKHRLNKAELALTKASGRLKEAEQALASAHQHTEICNQELLQTYARLASVGDVEFIEIVRARYAIDDAREAIGLAKEQVKECEEQCHKAVEDVHEARRHMAQCKRSLDAMEVIIGRMREEEAELEFAKEEDAVEDMAMSRPKKK
jgi:multidrug resistance efflux pump